MSQSIAHQDEQAFDNAPEDNDARDVFRQSQASPGTQRPFFTEPFRKQQGGDTKAESPPPGEKEPWRPSLEPRRPSAIQFNTSRAEDAIRRESVATGRVQSSEHARRISVGARKPTEEGRRLPSPPPKRYINFPRASPYVENAYI